MKYGLTYKLLGMALDLVLKDAGVAKETRAKTKRTYKEIVLRADDIGSRNRLLGAYGLAAYFIAMNRSGSLSPEENFKILEKGLPESKLYRAAMGSADQYFSEKNMQSRREWSKQTHEKKYKNDWVVDVIEKADDFEFGFDYLECGVCKLCRDENCFELAKYLCKLDFVTTEMMGVRLKRTMTLAEGCDKCDFRFCKINK